MLGDFTISMVSALVFVGTDQLLRRDYEIVSKRRVTQWRGQKDMSLSWSDLS